LDGLKREIKMGSRLTKGRQPPEEGEFKDCLEVSSLDADSPLLLAVIGHLREIQHVEYSLDRTLSPVMGPRRPDLKLLIKYYLGEDMKQEWRGMVHPKRRKVRR
jgi:hypothetical protein